mmetsp:Transcript_24195/g.52809  ORF Transcript_24195/g.52809 Transcript_24195/m.52809 type:complete len:210 (+) Transcript_24195:187-816(+)
MRVGRRHRWQPHPAVRWSPRCGGGLPSQVPTAAAEEHSEGRLVLPGVRGSEEGGQREETEGVKKGCRPLGRRRDSHRALRGHLRGGRRLSRGGQGQGQGARQQGALSAARGRRGGGAAHGHRAVRPAAGGGRYGGRGGRMDRRAARSAAEGLRTPRAHPQQLLAGGGAGGAGEVGRGLLPEVLRHSGVTKNAQGSRADWPRRAGVPGEP